MLPFEFVIDGPPVSQQARRRARLRDWISKVEDDSQVTDLLCRKRKLEDIRVEISSDIFLNQLDRGNEFLFIVVQDAPDQEVFNG